MAKIFRPLSWFRSDETSQQLSRADRNDASRPSPPASSPVDEQLALSPDRSTLAPKTPSNQTRRLPIRDQIEQLAYQKWRHDGCPEGRDLEYWLDAESEVLQESNDRPGRIRDE